MGNVFTIDDETRQRIADAMLARDGEQPSFWDIDQFITDAVEEAIFECKNQVKTSKDNL